MVADSSKQGKKQMAQFRFLKYLFQSPLTSGTAIKSFCVKKEIEAENLPKPDECFAGWINTKQTGNAERIMAMPILVSTGLDIIGSMVMMAVKATYVIGKIKWTQEKININLMHQFLGKVLFS